MKSLEGELQIDHLKDAAHARKEDGDSLGLCLHQVEDGKPNVVNETLSHYPLLVLL